jgi:heme/copper-type cytochrome/quinol oxidase subunit 4
MSNIDVNLLYGILLLVIISIGYLYRPHRYRTGLARRAYLQFWSALSGVYVLQLVLDVIQTRPGTDPDYIYASIIAICIVRVVWGLVKFARIKDAGEEGVNIGRYKVSLFHVLIVLVSFGLILLVVVRAFSGHLNWFSGLVLLFCILYLVYFQKLHASSIHLSNTGIRAGENHFLWSNILDYLVMDNTRLILRIRQSIPLWDIRSFEFPVAQRKVVEKYLAENVTGSYKLDGQQTTSIGPM